ncbi:MAG: hypothetical protein Q4D96_01650 [Propionibacteriaceae bacterium]|nr:hypothetical protein [Propionibacteriaceae bacterium]
MLAVFENRLAPLTYALGFLNAKAHEVTEAITRFLAGAPNVPTKVTQLTGSLEENLLHLQPLTIGGPPLLVTSTKLDGWSAIFDGHAQGQGVENRVSHMATIMNIRGYFFASVSPAAGPTHPLGGRHFHVLGPEAKFGQVRVVNLIENNPGKWVFELSGEPHPYEDLDVYNKRRKADRLTNDMLLEYSTSVGLHPWDENFYQNPSYLITNQQPKIRQYTLTEARKKLKLE